MQLEIFDVEHGACALLTCDNGDRMMIDCGHNANSGWLPGDLLGSRGVKTLQMLTITNFDEDHVSGLPNLLEKVDVKWLWRNKSVAPDILRKLKSEDGMGRGIDCLVEMMSRYSGDGTSSPKPDFPGIERKAFCHKYPTFDDENNLSMVLHIKINGVGFLFPGDLETKGWEALLEKNSDFRTAVANTHVLIASHHGRESGICDDIFTKHGCRPIWVVISDKGYKYETQKTVGYYASKTQGGNFNNEERKVLTTRNDGTIVFSFSPNGWWAEPAKTLGHALNLI